MLQEIRAQAAVWLRGAAGAMPQASSFFPLSKTLASSAGQGGSSPGVPSAGSCV